MFGPRKSQVLRVGGESSWSTFACEGVNGGVRRLGYLLSHGEVDNVELVL